MDRFASLLLLVATPAFATIWVDVEVTCPVCGTVNVFQAPGSFGSYVYDEPSRYQYVFWPATTDRFLYTCKKCHLTAYMGDFAEISREKVPALAAMLEKSASVEGPLTPYYEIPIWRRDASPRTTTGSDTRARSRDQRAVVPRPQPVRNPST